MKKITVWFLMSLCVVAANAGLVWELNADSLLGSGAFTNETVWNASTGSVSVFLKDEAASGALTKATATVAGGVSSTKVPTALVKDLYIHNNFAGLGARGTPVENSTGDVSIELWVRPTVSNTTQVVFETGGIGKGLSLTIGDTDSDGQYDNMRLAVGGTAAGVGSGYIEALVPATFSDGNLNQLVLTYDSTSGSASIYYNKTELAGGVIAAGLGWNGTDPFGIWGGAGDIGARDYDAISNDLVLGGQGDVGMVRYYDHVLPPTEVVQNFNEVAFVGYDGWAGEWGVDIGDATNDYDSDGLLNVYEYGLGGDPTNSANQGTSPEFGVMDVGGTNWFGYVHPQLSDPDSGLTYSLELNTDLVAGVWTNAGYAVMGTNVTGNALDFVTNVTDTVGGQKFIRLIIE